MFGTGKKVQQLSINICMNETAVRLSLSYHNFNLHKKNWLIKGRVFVVVVVFVWKTSHFASSPVMLKPSNYTDLNFPFTFVYFLSFLFVIVLSFCFCFFPISCLLFVCYRRSDKPQITWLAYVYVFMCTLMAMCALLLIKKKNKQLPLISDLYLLFVCSFSHSHSFFACLYVCLCVNLILKCKLVLVKCI